MHAKSTVGDVLRTLETRIGTGLARHMRIAVNMEFQSGDFALREGDDVAVIPPVAGGGAGLLLDVRDRALSLDEALAAVSAPEIGGIALFVGTVRDHSEGHAVHRLQYEAYREMCLREFTAIAEQAKKQFSARVAIVHRTGSLELGDLAVIVAAGAPHRAEAFAACRFVIDAVKQQAPIWKKEFGPDGIAWVGLDASGTSR